MPLRDRVIWGQDNPFSDPCLTNLDVLVRDGRRRRRLPPKEQQLMGLDG